MGIRQAMDADPAGHRSAIAVGTPVDRLPHVPGEAAHRRAAPTDPRSPERSAARFRKLVEATSDVIVELNADRIAEYVSPAIERVLGWTAREIVGRPLDHLLHPDDLASVLAWVGPPAVHPAGVLPGSFRARHRDGSWRRLEATVGDRLDDPDLGRIVVVARDVTERVEAQEAVARERDLLQAVIDAVPDPIYVKDLDGRYLRINRAAIPLFGVADPSLALGKTADDLCPPEEAARIAREDRHTIESGERLPAWVDPLDLDGERRWFLRGKAPLCGARGEVIALVGISRDITDLKRAEERTVAALDAQTATNADLARLNARLEQAAADLRAERDLLRAMMDTSPDPMAIKDRHHRYLRLNQAMADLLGASSPSVVEGRTDDELVGAERARRWREREAEVLWSGQPALDLLDVWDESEEPRYTLTSLAPFRDPGGAVVGLVGIGRDVTGLKRAEAGLGAALAAERAANRELEKLSRAKSGFISLLSHEFRTPLTSIQGFGELLRDAELTAGEVREYAVDIHRSAARLARLIDDILDLDRMQADRFAIARRPVDLNEQVAAVVAMLRPSAPRRRFSLALAPALPPVLGDADRLAQVLTNLLGNAVKYSPRGGAIEVTTGRSGEWARLAVRDEGVGIAPEVLEAIFEPYVRIGGSTGRRVVGTGLGLPITRQLVELHGGRVWAESAVGQGSTFFVELPLAGTAAERRGGVEA